jgi:hypothetical protein
MPSISANLFHKRMIKRSANFSPKMAKIFILATIECRVRVEKLQEKLD